MSGKQIMFWLAFLFQHNEIIKTITILFGLQSDLYLIRKDVPFVFCFSQMLSLFCNKLEKVLYSYLLNEC